MTLSNEELVTGVMVNYYFICKTKLWFFAHGLGQEDTSNLVKLGKLLHLKMFDREDKDVKVDRIAIDFVKKGDIIEVHEVKKTLASEEADIWQVKYYIHVLKKHGLRARGVIHYIKERKTVTVEDDSGVEEILEKVKEIIEEESPPKPIWSKFCKKCSYKDLCWI